MKSLRVGFAVSLCAMACATTSSDRQSTSSTTTTADASGGTTDRQHTFEFLGGSDGGHPQMITRGPTVVIRAMFSSDGKNDGEVKLWASTDASCATKTDAWGHINTKEAWNGTQPVATGEVLCAERSGTDQHGTLTWWSEKTDR